ncbi:antitoxin [Mycobacterium sp. MBM]|nr:antitoxin [Mycobacterium sp. MBM]
MSKQIAVRLPDEVVDFIDREVAQRRVESRASFVLKALERERRRLIAARDAAILTKRATADDDFDELAAHASTFELDID